MKISYYHVAGDVPEGIKAEAAVVVDVLRATTTIAWALNNGAETVQTFSDLKKLRETANNWPKESRLLLGERGGKRLDGFDLGNSPVAVVPDVVSGKRLFMSTTNGTRSLERVKNSKTLYTMSLTNRSAVAEKLLERQPKDLWIVGSGWEGSYSLEDSLAAGALVQFLLEKSHSTASIFNDEATSALAVWETWKNDPEGCLIASTHGQRLIGLGNHEADFKCCAALDQLSVVPTQNEFGLLHAE